MSQQYESYEQMSSAHVSHVFDSFTPDEQTEWAHEGLLPHDSPQIEPTSPTQTESHWVVQQ